MNSIVISILLVVVGIVVGLVGAFIVNSLRGNMASKKADNMINQAKKEIEKLKRDAAMEQKEEARKMKMDLDKEIKEKKDEIKESENKRAAASAEESARRIRDLIEKFDGFSAWEKNEIVKDVVRECVWDGETLFLKL